MVRLKKSTLALGRFLSEDVATVGVAALVFSGCRLTEALGGRPVGLDFILGHWGVSFQWVNWLGDGLRHAFRPAYAASGPLPARLSNCAARRLTAARPLGEPRARHYACLFPLKQD